MSATLTSRFPFIAAELRPRVSAAIKEGAEDVATGAKERVPVQTGALRDAIYVKRGGPAQYEVYAGDENAFYGHMVERGTKYATARPFLVPAADDEQELIVAAVSLVLRGL